MSLRKNEHSKNATPSSRRFAAPLRSRRARRRRGEDGQALVEFALLLPVLLLFVFGILKFGTVYKNYVQLTDAASAGARQLAIERGQASPCSDAAAQVDDAVGSLDSSQVSITLTDSNPADSGQTYSYPPASGTCPTLASGDAATVTATYPCDLSFMGINFYSSCKLTATTTQSVQ